MRRGWRDVSTGRSSDAVAEGAAEVVDGVVDGVVADAVTAELFRHRFVALARQMGDMLQRMGLSTNVKERLDFSCALLDAEGRLVVNAPHIPVHLGALGLCVRRVAETVEMGPGDVVITNHPGWGGSHLPDVTLITPVFAAGRRLGYVANRAHHAELGGSRPGSMPPAATCLAEEGVVIAPQHLVRADRADWRSIERLLLSGPYPSRAVTENLADLRAALAANRRGAEQLVALAGQHGAEVVLAQMRDLHALAAREARRALHALGALGSASHRATEHLDDGSPLAVEITVGDGRCRFDFTGSAPVHPGNLNATPAIVRSAVLYILRLLLDRPLPLNEGLMEPVELVIPEGILNPHFPDDPKLAPAVVGGNVETSQRLVDTLLKALGLAACSQGTMNNFLFGAAGFGYYETICGGAGAGPGFAGASAVHTHMTNTRITDPEVLELRYPVVLERFEIRRGSGGQGAHRGGDGARRVLRFTAPVAASFLTQHRTVAPYGVAGGGDGECGRQRVVRRDGRVEELGSIAQTDLEAGDRVVIETPGGGGWGRAESS